MMRGAFTFAVLLVLLGSQAGARPSFDEALANCSRAAAEKITALQMLKHPNNFEGRCVRISGIVAYRSIFDDLPSLYANMTGRDSNPEPHFVAVYSTDDALEDKLWGARENMDVVGVGTSCDAMYKRAEEAVDKTNAEAKRTGSDTESIVFMAGPCHYQGGPVITVKEAVPSAGETRLTGVDARAKYGNAEILTSPRDSVRKTIESFISAMKARDAKLLRGKVDDNWSGVTEATLFDPDKSPFTFLLGTPGDLQTVYFDTRLHEEALGEDVTGAACVCRKGECQGIWPITFSDMSARGGNLPFKCFYVYRDGHITGL